MSAEESMEAMLEALDEALAEGVKAPRRIVFVAYLQGDLKQFKRAIARARMKSCKITSAEAAGGEAGGV